MWKLALVYLFQWYALFCYWQNASKSISSVRLENDAIQNKNLYEEAVGWTGLVNGWYNVVTFLSAFALVGLARQYTPENGSFYLPAIGWHRSGYFPAC